MRNLKQNRFCKGMHKRHERWGDTFVSCVLGQANIQTRHPDNVKAILTTQFQDFDISNRVGGKIDLLLGTHGIFTQNGSAWSHTRAMLRPQFNKGQIVNDMDSLEFHVSRMTSLFPNNKVFDIQPYFFNLTLDTATEFLFGESVESLLTEKGCEPARGTFAEAFNTAQWWISLKLKSGPLHWALGNKETDRSCGISRAFVGRYVDKALRMDLKRKKEEGKAKYVFLEALAEEYKDRTVLTDQILNILLAGRDTTAGLLSFTMWFLARNKRVWHKLRTEVLEYVGKEEKPNWDIIKDMKYLKYVLNETLRLLPLVPVNSRAAVKRTTIPRGGGPDGRAPLVVEKGQLVFYSVYSTHRRREVYGDDAEEFNPERWETLRMGAWDYLPFNGGPRICLGQQYALVEASYTMIRLLQKYQDVIGIDPATGMELPGDGKDNTDKTFLEQLGLTMSSANGVYVKLVPAV